MNLLCYCAVSRVGLMCSYAVAKVFSINLCVAVRLLGGFEWLQISNMSNSASVAWFSTNKLILI